MKAKEEDRNASTPFSKMGHPRDMVNDDIKGVSRSLSLKGDQ